MRLFLPPAHSLSPPAVLGVTFCSPQLHCCCSLDCRPPIHPSITYAFLAGSECATDHCCIWRSDWHGIVRWCGRRSLGPRREGERFSSPPLLVAAAAAAAPPSPALYLCELGVLSPSLLHSEKRTGLPHSKKISFTVRRPSDEDMEGVCETQAQFVKKPEKPATASLPQVAPSSASEIQSPDRQRPERRGSSATYTMKVRGGGGWAGFDVRWFYSAFSRYQCHVGLSASDRPKTCLEMAHNFCTMV